MYDIEADVLRARSACALSVLRTMIGVELCFSSQACFATRPVGLRMSPAVLGVLMEEPLSEGPPNGGDEGVEWSLRTSRPDPGPHTGRKQERGSPKHLGRRLVQEMAKEVLAALRRKA